MRNLRYARLAVALSLATLIAIFATAELAVAQDTDGKARAAAADINPEKVASRAAVEIDGTKLFQVMGVPTFPAADRAAAIVGRIEDAAADPAIKSEQIHTVEDELGTYIVAGNTNLMLVTDDDAGLEGLGRKVIAEVYVTRVRTAVDEWRAARTVGAIERSVLLSFVAAVVFALAVVLLLWVARLARAALDRFRERIQSVGIQSFQVVRAERIRDALIHLLNVVTTLLIATLLFFFLDYVLRLFPWTRGTSIRLLGYVLEPLFVLGRGFITELPNIVFLVILFLITRWLLKMVGLFFGAIRRAEVTIQGFDSDWAEPTYKIVRVLVIAFAVVVAYPYIPGSSSEAFKGISLFVGVVFSLGSSSIVANTLAGYLMTYRRVFKIGDRVKIGAVIGDVSEMRVQVTHLRTIKNEEVTVPNSTILNSEVVNYSVLAKTKGLILHTTVGIGYETPWRQVEAMLLESARRTTGLMQAPVPFIRQLALGDFAVTYELNVYCDNVQLIGQIYTDLHRNILDVFNEYGVQIMTPAYEGDTPEPKIVPKAGWFAAPAKPESK